MSLMLAEKSINSKYGGGTILNIPNRLYLFFCDTNYDCVDMEFFKEYTSNTTPGGKAISTILQGQPPGKYTPHVVHIPEFWTIGLLGRTCKAKENKR